MAAAVDQATRRRREREICSPSSDEARPGPSGVRRSRSKIWSGPRLKKVNASDGQMWTRRQKRFARKKESAASSEDVYQSSDDHSPRQIRGPEMKAGDRDKPTDKEPVAVLTSGEDGKEAVPADSQKERGKRGQTRDRYSSSEDTVVGVTSKPPPLKRRPWGPKSKRAK